MANTVIPASIAAKTETNDANAAATRKLLADAGVLGVHLSGSLGSGKTALIEATIRRLNLRASVAVVVAHRGAHRDAAVLESAGALATAVQAQSASAEELHDAIASLVLGPRRLDLLLLENAGDLADEPPMDLGQAAEVAVFSVTGGDDKAARFPRRVRAANLVLLTKTDLLPYVKFDRNAFRNDVWRANPQARIIEVSACEGTGMEQWTDWLLSQSLSTKLAQRPQPPAESSEWWFG